MISDIWGSPKMGCLGSTYRHPTICGYVVYVHIPYYAYYMGYPLGYGVHVVHNIIMGMYTWGQYPTHISGVSDLG